MTQPWKLFLLSQAPPAGVAFAFAVARVLYRHVAGADDPLGFWPLLAAFAAGVPILWRLMLRDDERSGLWLLGYGLLSGVAVGLGYLLGLGLAWRLGLGVG